MTYTQLGLVGIVCAAVFDLYVVRTALLRRKGFWWSYAIIVGFQLITNGILTGFRIVRYNGDFIVGGSTPIEHAPAFFGDGRIAFAPLEDLLFGFALVLLTLSMWIWLGRRGVQRTPMAGPPTPLAKKFFWRNR